MKSQSQTQPSYKLKNIRILKRKHISYYQREFTRHTNKLEKYYFSSIQFQSNLSLTL
jgi:hypothetical protein